MICPNCNNEIEEGSVFCSECGSKIVKKEEVVFCGECGKKLTKGSSFCTECGAKVGTEQKVVKESKKTSTKKKIDEFKCSKCGIELTKDSSFCTECGTKVESDTSKTVSKKKKEKNTHTATLTVTRKKSIKGCAITFHVLVDGVKVGDLKNGTSISCEVEEGIHKVTISTVDKDTDQPIEVTKDRNSIEILTVAKMGLIAAKADIVDIIFK